MSGFQYEEEGVESLNTTAYFQVLKTLNTTIQVYPKEMQGIPTWCDTDIINKRMCNILGPTIKDIYHDPIYFLTN